MNNRRSFINRMGLLATSIIATEPAWSRNLHKALTEVKNIPADQLAGMEDFWKTIQDSFTNTSGIINFNNGGVSPAPRMVADAMQKNYEYCNQAPSFFMWRELDKGREPLRKSLAELAGCSAEEITMNRNSTEGLETIIFGLPLTKGDEVVASKQDYPHTVFAWKQREQRDGIKVNWINLDLPSEDEDYLVQQYVNAFTPRTKVVLVTHIINWNGQILPVKRIVEEAHKRNIEVVVDGAHSFAHFVFSLSDLDCDYFASSLHKWLYAPIGSGMLFVKKEKIKNIYPLFAGDDPKQDNIRKFEHLGTRPFFIEQAIQKAVEFHQLIGGERKEQRLHYLKNYWMDKIAGLPGVHFNTSLQSKWGCAIGNLAIQGRKPAELDEFLMNNYKIHTVGIEWENIHGVRITPNVYTTTEQLDLLVKAIGEFISTKKGS